MTYLKLQSERSFRRAWKKLRFHMERFSAPERHFAFGSSVGERTDGSRPPRHNRALTANPLAPIMRMLVAFLIFLTAVYVWDAQYNNGRLADGVRGMGRSIAHSMAP
jgi:hypothetical protein